MYRKFLLAILLTGIAGAAMAQNNYTLRGRVADAQGEVLPFTNCVLIHEKDSSFAYGTTGDMDGQFVLSGVTEGTYLLRVSFIGYEHYWQRIVMNQDTDLGSLVLIGNAILLKEVAVKASRPLYSADGEKVFYNVGDDPSVQSGNATDALQNAPGVEVDAEGNIKYRGGAEVTIWINDKPSHLKAESLKQYLKSLPAGTLQRIEVIAHPSAKYHTQNCVINIVTTAKVKRWRAAMPWPQCQQSAAGGTLGGLCVEQREGTLQLFREWQLRQLQRRCLERQPSAGARQLALVYHQHPWT